MRPKLRSMTIEEESHWSKDPESAKSGPTPSFASLKKSRQKFSAQGRQHRIDFKIHLEIYSLSLT